MIIICIEYAVKCDAPACSNVVAIDELNHPLDWGLRPYEGNWLKESLIDDEIVLNSLPDDWCRAGVRSFCPKHNMLAA